MLRFSYRRFPNGEVQSDFRPRQRRRPSRSRRAPPRPIPGAFPPAQIREIDRVIAASGREWPRRAAVPAANFQRYHRAGLDPLATSFIDGSVLNNKPFAEALDAIRNRPAYRQVDRRLVYIDPDPVQPPPPPSGRVPGLLHHAQGRAVGPAAQRADRRRTGVHRRLQRARAPAAGDRRFGATADRAAGDGARGVRASTAPFSVAQIHAWREAANERAAHDAGFAYQGYVRLKLDSVRTYVARRHRLDLRAARASPEAQASTRSSRPGRSGAASSTART